MEKLPKVLVNSLAGLCEEQELISWNINANGYSVSVNIKFHEKGYASDMHGSQYHDTPRTGLKANKSPGQLRRDYFRSNTFKRNTHLPKLDNSSESEENQLQNCDQVQVCEHGETPLQGMLPINSQDIPAVSPDEEPDPGHVQPAIHENENKTKAHGPGKQNSDHDQEISDDQKSVDNVQESRSAEQFSKITADFRAITEFTTLRGLTHSGEIVCYEPRNRRRQFYVLYEYDLFDNYNPFYGNALETVSRFDDISTVEYWKKDIEELCRKYDEYCKEMDDEIT